MKGTSKNGWKVCSRGHKFRGPRCTRCWKGDRANTSATKKKPRPDDR